MTEQVCLGIDLGTQSVRVLAVREDGSLAASAAQPLTSMRKDVRHEQSPELWWQAVVLCCRTVMTELGSATVVTGLAVDATSGTILLVDKDLGPLTPGLMYDDGRAREETALVNTEGETLWRELSYRMQPSWALPKLLWLARQTAIPPGAHLVHQNDYIHTRLAGCLLAADSSNSLKTGYDLIRNTWPSAIFDRLNLDMALFPEVVAPGHAIGTVSVSAAAETGLPVGTPIISGMTDGCAAQIASGATRPGNWHSVIGTTLVLKGVSSTLLHDPLGVVYSHRSADKLWLPGGASSTGAGVIARDFPTTELEALNRAALRAGPTSLVVYPLLGHGERYPFSAPEAHGFSLGDADSPLERFTGTLQGIAFLERLAFDALTQIGAPTDGDLTISGGATKSDALNQIRADVLGRDLGIPTVTEGAFGMAMLVAAQTSSLAEVTRRMVRIERTVTPVNSFSRYAETYMTLIQQLAARGWLPTELSDATCARASA